MGVSSRHILIYGWEVGYDTVSEWDYEEREEWYYKEKKAGEVALVADSMAGKYALVGVLQFCSDNRRRGAADIPMQRVEEPSREQERALYEAVYQKMELDPEGEPEHILLTHHS